MQRVSCVLFSVYKPAMERRHRRSTSQLKRREKREHRSTVGELSAGAFMLNWVRRRLPPEWQYGVRWKYVIRLWNFSVIGFAGYLIYYFFLANTDEAINEKASQYTYIRDDQGNVVDIGYKPIVDAARHARKRVSRMIEEFEEEESEH